MAAGRQQGSVKVIVVVVVLGVVLLAAGIGTALYLAGVLATDDGAEVADQGPGPEEVEPAAPARYLEFDSAITVNLGGGGARRILQARVQVMARDEDIIAGVEKHMPVIRNNLIMLFSDQQYEALGGREGKEALRQEALEEINAVLDAEQAPGPVEALYFTSFVMQ